MCDDRRAIDALVVSVQVSDKELKGCHRKLLFNASKCLIEAVGTWAASVEGEPHTRSSAGRCEGLSISENTYLALT
jgi:hypothetical protein